MQSRESLAELMTQMSIENGTMRATRPGAAFKPSFCQVPRDAFQSVPGDTFQLQQLAPLLKEVGSFPGQADQEEDPIFDLGGNAAEWVVTENRTGKVIGG